MDEEEDEAATECEPQYSKNGDSDELEKALDKACLKHFGFSPATLNELFDVLEHCHTLIHYYLDTTSSLSGDMRNEIVALSTDTDILSLDIDGLYLTAADLKALAKGHYYFGKRIRADEKKTRKFLADLEKFRRNLECLVLKTRSYIEKVRRFKSY